MLTSRWRCGAPQPCEACSYRHPPMHQNRSQHCSCTGVFPQSIDYDPAAVAAYGRLISQYLPERPQVQLSRQGFPPVHGALPQRNGCWCEQSILDLAFVSADGSKQLATVNATRVSRHASAGTPIYVCHKQGINEYPASPTHMSKNLGKIEFDDKLVTILPDIYGVATLTNSKPIAQRPHVAHATVVASCVDTNAANCGYPGHQCVATGTLTINVRAK